MKGLNQTEFSRKSEISKKMCFHRPWSCSELALALALTLPLTELSFLKNSELTGQNRKTSGLSSH